MAAENEPLICNVRNCCTEYPEAGFRNVLQNIDDSNGQVDRTMVTEN